MTFKGVTPKGPKENGLEEGEVKGLLARVVEGASLTADEMADVVGAFMDAEPAPAQVGALLTALRMKGDSVAEVVGAARAMRSRMVRLPYDPNTYTPVVDTCGTGGDGSGTVNISTLSAFVVAGCGVPVAKHGNRALSSRSGSHDVIEALGLNPAPAPTTAARCLADTNLGFMFAPLYHGATKNVAVVRRQLGFRTLFNLLGPLTNPAGARHHVNGVYARDRVRLVAEAHKQLGAEAALVVHGAAGIDEIAVAGPTSVAELKGGVITEREVSPVDFGLDEHDPAGLAGGSPAMNAERILATLRGESGAIRAAALLNAAAALYVVGKAATLKEGAELSRQSLDEGRALQVLEGLRALSPAPVSKGSVS